jgi:hypothetical protein
MRLNKILVVVISLLLTNGILAQETIVKKYKGTTNMGIVHSFNSANFWGAFEDVEYLNMTESVQTNSRFSLAFGFMAEYYVSEKLSLELNTLLSSCGSFVTTKTSIYNEVGVFEGSSTIKYVLRYIKAPLMINVYPTEHFYISGGGYASMLVEARQYAYWYQELQSVEDINQTDAGLLLGMGLNTPIMRIGIQYTHGLIPILTDDTKPAMYNQMIEIVCRWKIYSEARKK